MGDSSAGRVELADDPRDWGRGDVIGALSAVDGRDVLCIGKLDILPLIEYSVFVGGRGISPIVAGVIILILALQFKIMLLVNRF